MDGDVQHIVEELKSSTIDFARLNAKFEQKPNLAKADPEGFARRRQLVAGAEEVELLRAAETLENEYPEVRAALDDWRRTMRRTRELVGLEPAN